MQFGSILALDREKCDSSPRIFAKYRNRIPMAQYANEAQFKLPWISFMLLFLDYSNKLGYILAFLCAKFILCRSIAEGNNQSHRTV